MRPHARRHIRSGWAAAAALEHPLERAYRNVAPIDDAPHATTRLSDSVLRAARAPNAGGGGRGSDGVCERVACCGLDGGRQAQQFRLHVHVHQFNVNFK